MKLISYQMNNANYVGALTQNEQSVITLPYPDMNTLITTSTSEQNCFDALRSITQTSAHIEAAVPLSQIRLLAPIPHPRQDVICLGLNYRDHIEELVAYDATSFVEQPTVPIFFSKRVNEAVAPDGYIESHPNFVTRLDYEVELAVIVGKEAKNVSPEDAKEYIFGYTILNDVSARLLQTRHGQWYFGKSLDGFTPMGPVLITADEIPFPPALTIQTRVNGKLRQTSNTSLLLTDIPHILSTLTQGMTLLPGTIIATGTPAGVGLSFDPPCFLQSGDVVECEIEAIGCLRNTVR